MADNAPSPTAQSTLPKSAWQSLASSKSLWLAFVLTIGGGAAWVYSAVTRPEPVRQIQTSDGQPGRAGFVGSNGDQTTTIEPEPRLIDRISPAVMKLGLSFMVGFLLAWGMRRFIKWTIAIALALGVGIYLLRKSGLFDVNYDEVQGQVNQGLDWARAQAGEVRELLGTYAPSATGAVAGMFFGIRR